MIKLKYKKNKYGFKQPSKGRVNWGFFNYGTEMQKYASLSVSVRFEPNWVA